MHGYDIKTYLLTAARFLHISAVIFFQYVGVLIYRRIQVTGKFWDLKWIDVDQAFLRGKSTYLRKKKKKRKTKLIINYYCSGPLNFWILLLMTALHAPSSPLFKTSVHPNPIPVVTPAPLPTRRKDCRICRHGSEFIFTFCRVCYALAAVSKNSCWYFHFYSRFLSRCSSQ